jgi:hypothetical protein
VVGLEINANHLRAVRSGTVTGTTRPIHIGRSTQVWEIRIEDEFPARRTTVADVTGAPASEEPAPGHVGDHRSLPALMGIVGRPQRQRLRLQGSRRCRHQWRPAPWQAELGRGRQMQKTK